MEMRLEAWPRVHFGGQELRLRPRASALSQVDSVHSPVRKVNYLVEAARLGQITDYDKLTARDLDQRARFFRPMLWASRPSC